MGMILPELGKKPFGRIAFTIILGRSVLSENHLRAKGDDFLAVGMDQSCPESLQVVSDFALTHLFHTKGRVKLFGRKIPRSIQTQKIAPIHEHHVPIGDCSWRFQL